MKTLKNRGVLNKPISLKKYCIVSILISIILNSIVYFHAFVAFFNVALLIAMIVFFKKGFDVEKKKKVVVYMFFASLFLCNAFSILMVLLMITSFALVVAGEMDFNELMNSIM